MTTPATKAKPVLDPALAEDRVKLPANALKLEEHVRRRHWVKAPADATKESCRYPEFWQRIAPSLMRHDIVFLIADDESWELELRVEKVRVDGVEVSIVKNVSRAGIQKAVTILTSDYHCEWRPNEGWCVLRTKDGFAEIRGHGSEAAAILAWQRSQPTKVV